MKKPYGRGITPRTRLPGGVNDFFETNHSHRGKRGGRGGNKNCRGRRPRLHIIVLILINSYLLFNRKCQYCQ